MKSEDITWKNLSLQKTISTLKQLAKENGLKWEDEIDGDFSNEVEFLLESKGRWLLCHIGKTYPYIIRFRLIGDRNYERIKPKDFIYEAKQLLLH